ncbi:cryptochrome/photolyase family protein [Pseudohoeflea coraliihabitans]|uniref:DNA photolyase family protein n=1 Tax=Pseudohoeflea coraliihabitans TaxID=2860393 RepID=A0ABS6WQ63_9HYPH|nr:deoxyribodipyrimidine photo-lyase [Pseudohoeflea sp. DP4N28-3]MBW3098102.1 DNA photolyase family protein [Pseudohoeflea sp. DP4N28-3]
MPGNDAQDIAVHWFRTDLRLTDNAALAAAARCKAIVPLYIRETPAAGRAIGAAKQWWLHHSLTALDAELRRLGAPLILATGEPYLILSALARDSGATRLVGNRRYEPAAAAADEELADRLRADGLEVDFHAGFLLHEPTRLKSKSGKFYRVFTPFWRTLESELQVAPPAPAPGALKGVSGIASEALADWALLPQGPDWAGGLRQMWTPGEQGARDRLSAFLNGGIENYAEGRDVPSRENTSRLSPHLALGEISPAQILHALRQPSTRGSQEDRETLRKEIGWREFCWHLLVNEPFLPERNHDARFDDFPWHADDDAHAAWQRGRTGYPIVDAGMRQLWRHGYMHNRVRMIVASFLTKHLLSHWQIGERWFWDTLVDADPASNVANWQWVAGTGADAAPYFRIFNPILQGEKFDPDGAYVRHFVPEIAALPDRYIHKPWDAPEQTHETAGITLGVTYPKPLIEHRAARQRALAAYQQIKDAA